MDEFIKLLNQDYELIQYRIKDKEVVFHIQSSKRELACPFNISEGNSRSANPG